MDGWVKVHRSLLDHPLWLEHEFSKGQAWVDLIAIANHTPSVIHRRGIRVEILRGQVGHSYRSLAERWKWSTWKVQKFMDFLVSEDMICKLNNDTQNETVSTLITIVNYEKFQETQTQNNTQTKRKTTQNKNVKKEKKETLPNEKTIRPIPDCIEKQIVLWWSVSYEKVMGRPYQIAWKRDMDCAKKLMEISKGDKKNAIIAGCQLLNEEREAKTLTNLGNGYWNRRPPAVDSMALGFIEQGIFPPMRTTLKDWLTEKINGADNQQ